MDALARRTLASHLVAVLRERAGRLLAHRCTQQSLPLVARAPPLVLNVLQLLLQRLHAREVPLSRVKQQCTVKWRVPCTILGSLTMTAPRHVRALDSN